MDRKARIFTAVAAASLSALLATTQVAVAQTDAESSPSPSPMASMNANGNENNTPGFVLGSKLIGSQVKSQQNEELGTINNLVVNPTTGHIRFAVVSTNGKKVLVPWSALNAEQTGQGQKGHFVLNTSKEKLSSAPKFNPNNLSQLYNRAAEEPVFTYYDIIWFPDVATPEEQNARSGHLGASPGASPYSSPTTGTSAYGTTPSASPYSSPATGESTYGGTTGATATPYATATPGAH